MASRQVQNVPPPAWVRPRTSILTTTWRWPGRCTRRWPLAGITTVGEFHYVHHGPGGQPYSDQNAMGHALQQAARDAGIRLTLLDTCYLEGGLDATGHLPLDELQLRFSDKTVDSWASRAGDIDASPGTVNGRGHPLGAGRRAR